jgi:hypothetical protein
MTRAIPIAADPMTAMTPVGRREPVPTPEALAEAARASLPMPLGDFRCRVLTACCGPFSTEGHGYGYNLHAGQQAAPRVVASVEGASVLASRE